MSDPRTSHVQEDIKRREYFKQQQQLKCMPKNNISADAMIENLLSKKEIFQKKSTTAASGSQGVVPGVYESIWQWCRAGGQPETADTTKLSALLLTSGLSTDTLGYIWSLSNQTMPGVLTQPEVYNTLALIALAQSGLNLNLRSVLSQVRSYPVPALDMRLLAHMSHTPSTMTASSAPPPAGLSPGASMPLTMSSAQTISMPSIAQCPGTLPLTTVPTISASVAAYTVVQTQTSSLLDDDEFDDFKSADLSSLNVENLRVVDIPTMNPPSDPSSLGHPAKIPGPPLMDVVEDLFPKCSTRGLNLLEWDSPVKEAVKEPSTSLLDLDPVPLPDPPEPADTVLSDTMGTMRLGDSPLLEGTGPDLSDPLPPLLDPLMDRAPSSCPSSSPDAVPSSGPSPDPVSSDPSPSHQPPSSSPSPEPPPPTSEFPSFLTMDEDKYSALRGLNLSSSPPPSTDSDFGDFLTALPSSTIFSPNPPLALTTQNSIQEECLNACIKILKEAVSNFDAIMDEKLLTEVLDDHRCKKYLEELGEVYRVSERLSAAQEVGRDEARRAWANLTTLTRHATPTIRKEEFLDDEGDGAEARVRCGICRQESRQGALVRYPMNHFHATCANLFLHCVPGAQLPLQPLL